MNQRTCNALVQAVYSAQFWSGGFMSDTALVAQYLYQKKSDRKIVHSRMLFLDDHWDDLCLAK